MRVGSDAPKRRQGLVLMGMISSAQVDSAIAKLPRQSNASIEQVLANARRLQLNLLVNACSEELQARGALTLTAAEAEQIAEIGTRIADKSLSEIIEIAFREVAAKAEEIIILRWVASHPGVSYAELLKIYGRNDLSLVIGHLVHYRFGYFRPFLKGVVQSELLLERQAGPDGVQYSLRPEALQGLRSLGIMQAAA